MTASSWNQQVWHMVRQIPKGKVASYGQIARMLNAPRKARHVGYALHSTPKGVVLPWQRVINSQGKISFPEESDHHQLQRALLQSEGIEFDASGKVDLKRFGWRP